MIAEHIAAQHELRNVSSTGLTILLLGAAAVIIAIALTSDSILVKSIVAAYVLLP